MYLILYCATLMLTEFTANAKTVGPHTGSCPDIEAVKNFDPVKFQGVWHLVGGYHVESGAPSENCATTNFKLNSANSSAFDFFTKGLTSKENWSWINGTGMMVNPEKQEGLLHVAIKGSTVPYYIIGTDYKTYAIVYTCWNKKSFHHFAIWLLSRTKVLNVKDYPEKEMHDLLEKVVLDADMIQLFDQSNCSDD